MTKDELIKNCLDGLNALVGTGVGSDAEMPYIRLIEDAIKGENKILEYGDCTNEWYVRDAYADDAFDPDNDTFDVGVVQSNFPLVEDGNGLSAFTCDCDLFTTDSLGLGGDQLTTTVIDKDGKWEDLIYITPRDDGFEIKVFADGGIVTFDEYNAIIKLSGDAIRRRINERYDFEDIYND